MTTKNSGIDHIESSRKILNAPASKLAELEAAAAVLSHVVAETDAEIEAMASRRKTLASSDAPALEIDKMLERHDDAVRALTCRNEIAAAIAARFNERIDAEREAENAAQAQAAYDKARELGNAAMRDAEDFFEKCGRGLRRVMRVCAEADAAILTANKNLPPGASLIPSIDARRMGHASPPKVTVRKFGMFVDGKNLVGEQGRVQAWQDKGVWIVLFPSSRLLKKAADKPLVFVVVA
jgi:hypothetical protein